MNYDNRNLPKLHLLCSKDDLRPNMSAIYFDPCGYAVATNAHILAAIPFSELNDMFNTDFTPLAGRYLSADTWKMLLKKNNLVYNVTPDSIELTSGTYKSLTIEQLGDFPKWQQILPVNYVANKIANNSPAPSLVGFNAKLAFELAEALGVGFINLFNPAPADMASIKALFCVVGKSIGLLMPVMVKVSEYEQNVMESIEALNGVKHETI
jgi:hypothetical protein